MKKKEERFGVGWKLEAGGLQSGTEQRALT